jgi:hypothetical protein
MIYKKSILTGIFFLLSLVAFAQEEPVDSLANSSEEAALDDDTDYDQLLDELGSFIDSLLAPRSYFLANVSAATGHFNFKSNSGLITQKKLVLSPTVGYYHKYGPGITFSGNISGNDKGKRLYQYSISPSFDFIQSRKWTGGISYTRYFTKDSLAFYTSPLQNDVGAYFLWRKAWVQPGMTFSYGWGSRTDLKERTEFIKQIYRKQNNLIRRLRANLITGIDTVVYTSKVEESIVDFSLTTSIRHTFYWLELSKHNDYFKFTPMLAFSFGTQKFGFNRTTGTTVNGNVANVQFSRGDVNLDDKLKFQPLSLTFYLRPEYSIGKFFIQPQLIFDYYFPAEEKNFTTLFSMNGGFMF